MFAPGKFSDVEDFMKPLEAKRLMERVSAGLRDNNGARSSCRGEWWSRRRGILLADRLEACRVRLQRVRDRAKIAFESWEPR